MSNLSIKTVCSIHHIDADGWNQLGNGQPFQSHQWYVFGEQVMSDCQPLYLLAYDDTRLVARASLWCIHNEPIPKMLGPFRKTAAALIKRWPLLICRSPFAYSTGLAFADGAKRADILAAFAESALVVAKQQKASFIIFDYLQKSNISDCPPGLSAMHDLEPGTCMENHWANLDEYLAAGNKKDRQHYKRVMREAQKLGITIEQHADAGDMDDTLSLIRNVEQEHGARANPWARQMLEHMQMVNGSFLTAKINEKLVGCGLILEDNASQMTSLLGLAKDIPYVYFMLVYESLSMAFEHKVHLLRWGSGAYDVKQRLGFSLEDNNSLVFSAVNPYVQKALQRFI